MQLKSIGESLTALNSINKVLTNTSLSLESNQVALTAIGKQYSTTTLKAAIAQSQLNKEQIKTILSANGLQGELLETTADELANAASTNLVAKSQAEATLTTTGLSNAFKGLIASIKGLVTAHPIISTVSIALAAIGSIAYVISDLAKAEKRESDAKLELFEKSKEKVQANQNETKSLNELIEKYKELSSKSNISLDDREEIKEIQNDIIDLIGTEAQQLDLVNGKLENQLNILKNISVEKSKQNVEDARDNYYNAAYSSDVMVGSADDYGNDVVVEWVDSFGEEIHKIKGFEHINFDEVTEYMWDNGFSDIFRQGFSWYMLDMNHVVDTTDIDGLENKVKRLTEFKDFLADNGLISTGLYQGVASSIQQYQTQRNNEIKAANILVDTVVDNLAKSNNELAEINVDSLETFEQYRQKLINEAKNDDGINKALVDGVLSNDNLETAVNNFMATGSEFSTWYQQWKNDINNPTSNNDILFDKSFDKINKDFQELTENAELLFSINKEISEIGRVSAENLSKIAEAFPEDKYPEMTKSLYEYQLGLISVQDLFAELEVCYETDKNNYIQSLIKKSEADEQYFLLMREKYPEIFKELTEMYGKDVENWKSIAKAKEEIDSILIKSLSNRWKQYFHAIMGSDGKYSLLSSGFDDSDIALTNPATAEKLNQEYDEYKGMAQGFIDDANHALELLDKISYKPTDFNLSDLSWKGLGNSSNSNSSSDSSTTKDYDLIERAIQKLEREISNLDTIINNTFTSWNERNTALLSQIDKINEKINTQQVAYEEYMNLANNVGLDSYYQDLIKNGSIDVITITDKNLQNQIDTFQDFYDKALEAQDSVQELQSRLNELDKTKFDNIVKQFENIQNNISHTINMIDKKLDFIEEKGFFANSSIYENLINQYEKQLNVLYDKHDKLTITLNSSDILEGSQAWNELKQQINEVNESIIDTIISIEQFSNELNKNEFSKFDYFQDKINKLTTESDFYIDLMEAMDKKTVDENGNYTNEGWTNAGLHAQNYNTYLKQAEEYAQKIDGINKQLENDPYNTVLLEQKQKYIEAQRESILAAYEEKNAIKDLIKAGYEEQSNSLNKIIDKYKDLLSSMKEAHDYEKNIREQTENLANLNKQYLAVLGDDSEGNRKNIQQLENDIREAQEELQETQYEKLISDTEKLLDDLQSDYEELMNQRLDNIDTELVNIFNGINENANIIKDTLHQLSIDSDMLLSQEIKDIWNNPQPVIDLNTSVDAVNENISGTNTAIDNLRHCVEAILNKMDMIINEKLNQIENVDSNNTTYTPNIDSSNNIPDYSNNNSNNNNSNYQNDNWWKYKADYYPKENLNIETSIVDRLKWHDYDSSREARSIYYEKMGLGSSNEYYDSYDQNVAMLSWMKANGYANGSRYINKRQIAFTQEKGSEMIYDKSTGSMLTPISMEQFIHSLQQKSGTPTYLETGDKVFTNQMSENLWKIARNPYDFGIDIKPDLDYDIPTTTFGNRSNNVKIEFGDVCVSLPNIKNYQEFMQQAQADKNFARMIENIALGKAFGANTFDKFTFR